MKKRGERQKKPKVTKNNEKCGRKKMSTVIGVYTVAPNKRSPETFLSKETGKEELLVLEIKYSRRRYRVRKWRL